jgi:heme-degrading monooxygenase HmoA
MKCSVDRVKGANPADIAEWLGLDPYAGGFIEWDVFDAVLSPGEMILMAVWKDAAAAKAFTDAANPKEGARQRSVRIVRDYGMFDRREAPQYYPDAVDSRDRTP